MDADLGWNTSAAVTYGGVQGELTLVRVNFFRAFLEHLLVMTTGETPAFMARALNMDYQSQAQTELAEGLVQFYMRERGLKKAIDLCAEYSLLFGEGWLLLGWDPHEGEVYGAEPVSIDGAELRPVKTGDVRMLPLEPIDVVRDVTCEIEDQTWHIVHTRRNKWDLAARFPEFREQIITSAISPVGQVGHSYPSVDRHAPDIISCYELFHKRTDELPEGRYAFMVGDRLVMSDVLPYRDYPVIPMMPSPETRSAFGYSRCWDTMALQEGVDSIASNMLTIHDA
jgi:hypothetical protein